MANVVPKPTGDSKTTDYRVFFEQAGNRVSPWHDVPVEVDKAKGLFTMLVEIPRGTNAKLEISTGEEFNPIKQDVKKGQLRFVADVNGAKGYPWNYGAFPQTWENPLHKDHRTGALGDNDPLDVVEIGEKVAETGQFKVVKVLGTLAMIDEGETDWKIVVIDVTDPLAAQLNDIDDVERVRPGYLQAMHDWFRDYKIPDGKPPNVFAFDGKFQNRALALEIIEENRKFWHQLVTGETPATTERYKLSVKHTASL